MDTFSEFTEPPAILFEITLNVYDFPFVNPETTIGLDGPVTERES